MGFLLVLLVVPEMGFANSRPDMVVKKIRETSLAILQKAYQNERAFVRAAAARAAGASSCAWPSEGWERPPRARPRQARD